MSDPSESHIAEDLGEREFVLDILNYIENIKDERGKFILKESIGFCSKDKLSITEIAKKYGISRPYASRILKKERKELEQYIAKHYPLSFPEFAEKQIKKQFSTEEERDSYVFNSFFGKGGFPQKTAVELEEEVGVSYYVLKTIIERLMNQMNEEEKEQLEIGSIKLKGCIKYIDELCKAVAEDCYGLNGKQMLAHETILERYHINSVTRSRLTLKYLNQNFDSKTKEELFAKRAEFDRREILKRREYIYNSYYGLKDHEKKSLGRLADELNISSRTAYKDVLFYAKYLTSQATEQKDQCPEKQY